VKTSVVFLMAVCLLFAGDVLADDVFKWVDDKGNVHFTDNPDTIPEKYRKKTQHRKMKAPAGQEVGDTTIPAKRRQTPRGSTRATTRGTRFQMKKWTKPKISKEQSEKARKEKEKKKAEAAQKAYTRCLMGARNQADVSRCVSKRITKPAPFVIQP